MSDPPGQRGPHAWSHRQGHPRKQTAQPYCCTILCVLLRNLVMILSLKLNMANWTMSFPMEKQDNKMTRPEHLLAIYLLHATVFI